MPVVLTGLAAIAIAAAIGALSLHARTRLFRKRPRHGDEPGKNTEDIAGYVTSMVGIFYALIVGLSLVSVWGNRDTAALSSRAEASGLHETYVLAATLPPAQRTQIQTDAAAYVHYVETVEWPLMQGDAALPKTGASLLSTLHHAVGSVQPIATAQSLAVSEINTQISLVDAARAARLNAAALRMPPLLWLGLSFGGVLVVTLAFAHSVERHLRHLTMIVSLTSLIGFVMTLIYLVNNPFDPGFGVGAATFAAAFQPG